MEKIVVDARSGNQRLDKYLKRYLPNAAAGFLYRMLREKKIKVNGRKADGSLQLKENDEITIFFSEDTLNKFKGRASGAEEAGKHARAYDGFDFGKHIVYEDDGIVIFNKPAGMLSQKADKDDISACELLVSYMISTGQAGADSIRIFKPSAVNRLDRNTSGILVCAKTLPAAQELSAMFRERSLKKEYLALVCGDVRERREVCAYLKKNAGTNKSDISMSPARGFEKIETVYEPVGHIPGATLLNVDLITGKSHQIRAHLSALGHPIAGDPKYSGKGNGVKGMYGLKRQFLHAYRLTFPQCKGPLEHLSGRSFTAPLPDDLKRVLDGNERIY